MFALHFQQNAIGSNRECFAHKLQHLPKNSNRRDKLSVIAKRVEHLRIEILVASCEIVVQMLNPYIFW